MAQKTDLGIEFFASGFCIAHANIVNPRLGKGKTNFYAVWALLQIPEIGYVLFDTGYNEQFEQATHLFPDRLYRWMTPVSVKEKNTAKSILESKGILEHQIKYIIVSHFHADHISGLKDFTSAKFICSTDAFVEVQKLSGVKAVRKGILQHLIPQNFKSRALMIEEFADKIVENRYGLKEYHLFGSTQFKLVSLPGHARGMLGFMYQDNHKSLFYATDASWSYETFENKILPRSIVKLFFDSWTDFITTLKKLRAFEMGNPEYKVLFTHCPKILVHISNEI